MTRKKARYWLDRDQKNQRIDNAANWIFYGTMLTVTIATWFIIAVLMVKEMLK